MESIDYLIIPEMHCFLKTDSRLTPDDRMSLLTYASQIYGQGERACDVMGENYCGRLRTSGEWVALSGMAGQRFEAELETVYGKSDVSFLIHGALRVVPVSHQESGSERWH